MIAPDIGGRFAHRTSQREGQALEANVNGRFIVNDVQTELELARRGLALAQTVGSIVAEEIARGNSLEVLDEHAVSLGAAYLYFPTPAQMSPRLRVFLDHFCTACGAVPRGQDAR